MKLKFFDYKRFDIEHYEFFERVENGMEVHGLGRI